MRFAMRSEPHMPTAQQRSSARAGTRTHECAHHASTDAHAHDCVRTFMHGAHLWLWRQRNTAVVRVKGVRNPPQSTQEAPDSKIPCRVGYHAVCRTPCRAGYRAVWDTVQSRRRYGRGEPSPGADALDVCVQRERGEAPESALLPSSGQNATVHSAWYAYRSSVCTQSCGWSHADRRSRMRALIPETHTLKWPGLQECVPLFRKVVPLSGRECCCPPEVSGSFSEFWTGIGIRRRAAQLGRYAPNATWQRHRRVAQLEAERKGAGVPRAGACPCDPTVPSWDTTPSWDTVPRLARVPVRSTYLHA